MRSSQLVKKAILEYLVPLALFILWITMFLVYLSSLEISLTTIEKRHNLTTSLPYNLTQGKIITQKFIATNDNLGQVAIRFQTHLRINKDQLVFKIKPSSSPTWTYEGSYKTDQFQPNQLFPIGFPVFTHSKGEEFTWELSSFDSDQFNYVTISNQKPVFVSRYQFNKAQMFSDKKEIISFLFEKTINVFQNPDSLAYFLLWGAPLLAYLFAAGFFRKYLFLASTLPFTILIIDNFFIIRYYDTITILIFFYWLIITLIHRVTNNNIFWLSVFSLLAAAVLSIVQPSQAEKSMIWFFLFLIILSLTNLISSKKSQKKK